jgi:hypothetical protein
MSALCHLSMYFSAAHIPSIVSELQDMSELYERRVMVILPI